MAEIQFGIQMKTQAEFTSDMFKPMLGEEEKTNPGIFGQALAEWVKQALEAEGIPVVKVIPEDWGWCVVTMNDRFRLWVGCSNMEDEKNRWRCFVVAELGFFQKLRKSIDPTPFVAEVVSVLQKVISAEPRISDVRWVDENEA